MESQDVDSWREHIKSFAWIELIRTPMQNGIGDIQATSMTPALSDLRPNRPRLFCFALRPYQCVCVSACARERWQFALRSLVSL